jgi:LysM repeat protein
MGCNPPQGWSPYVVKPGDTLFALAKQVNLTPEELMRSNCLASSIISVGHTLYLPVESCTPFPPPGWSIYVVRSGDTLSSLATIRDTTVTEVKRVNCLSRDSLEVGGQLYLPPLVSVSPSTTAHAETPTYTPTPALIVTTGSAEVHDTATPGILPTPLPTLIVEAEWPNELQTGVSDFVRISLIGNPSAGYTVTVERPGHEGVVGSPVPVGTKVQPLLKAFGPAYQACAAPNLNSTTISVKPETVDCRSLEEGPWQWDWSISSDKIGLQLLILNMTVKWTPQNGGESISREIWHQRVYVDVKQPLIVMGQLIVLPIVGGLIGAAFTVPYLSEWWKARKSQPRGRRKKKRQ